jgi:hypothetical protein
MMLASGRSRHHRLTSAGSRDASICQAAEIGWAPGAGQPTRSQEQARPWPRGWPRETSAGTRCRADSVRGVTAPGHSGQPSSANSTAAAARPPASARRRARRGNTSTIGGPTPFPPIATPDDAGCAAGMQVTSLSKAQKIPNGDVGAVTSGMHLSPLPQRRHSGVLLGKGPPGRFGGQPTTSSAEAVPRRGGRQRSSVMHLPVLGRFAGDSMTDRTRMARRRCRSRLAGRLAVFTATAGLAPAVAMSAGQAQAAPHPAQGRSRPAGKGTGGPGREPADRRYRQQQDPRGRGGHREVLRAADDRR